MKLLICIFLSAATGVCAQEKLDFGDTPTTNSDPKYKSNPKEYKNRRIIHWRKTSTKGLLIGNRCAEEVTNDMGFVYLTELKGQLGNGSELSRLVHNFGAKFRIMMRNGPFWKWKLKKRTKECRRETGDFVG